ncbi:hypothetical protein BKA64DRAFT_739848 [Cadophora sp. MPI-SDFR-AT-0126]|nr:hypothetical protein BKA64DRAFT_739848 [Leotiomycetes sp. MPI-SDFR-AT-0126]
MLTDYAMNKVLAHGRPHPPLCQLHPMLNGDRRHCRPLICHYFIIHKANMRSMSFDGDAVGNSQLGAEFGSSNVRSGTESGGRRSEMGSGGGKVGTPDWVWRARCLRDKRRNCERESRNQQVHTTIERANPILKRISYQLMIYPLVYMLILTIPPIIRTYQTTTGISTPFAISTVDKACIVTQAKQTLSWSATTRVHGASGGASSPDPRAGNDGALSLRFSHVDKWLGKMEGRKG